MASALLQLQRPCAPSTSGRGSEATARMQPLRYSQLTQRRSGAHAVRTHIAGPSRRADQRALITRAAAGSSPKRDVSVQQRFRIARQAVILAIEKLWARYRETAAGQALAALVARLSAALQPARDAWERVDVWWGGVYAKFVLFVEQDSRRFWAWELRHRKEVDLWDQAPTFAWWCIWSAFYMAVTPVSVVLGGLLPVALAWILWDDWPRRPLFLTWLVFAPLKFLPPWTNICWIWPGLI